MKPLRNLYWCLITEAYAASNRFDFVTAWVLAEEARLVFERDSDCEAEPLAAVLLLTHLQTHRGVIPAGVEVAMKAGALVNWPEWLEPHMLSGEAEPDEKPETIH